VFVFALSQNSIQSKPCQAELRYAQDLGPSSATAAIAGSSGRIAAEQHSASEPASVGRGDQGPPPPEVRKAAVGNTRRLTVAGALIVAFAILNLVIFSPWPDFPALYWRFEQLPFLSAIFWLILAAAFGFAQRQLRAAPGEKILAWT
jgi:hypothetical protein